MPFPAILFVLVSLTVLFFCLLSLLSPVLSFVLLILVCLPYVVVFYPSSSSYPSTLLARYVVCLNIRTEYHIAGLARLSVKIGT